MASGKPSAQESIKENSQYLRGNIAQDLASPGEQVTDETYELLKFHGSYFGYDRDSATVRKKQGLDKEYEFMVRLKMPGGQLTAAQYLAMDALADEYANGTLRITTRETFQFHCIKKTGMKPLIAAINRNLLSTLGGCGDVVRNIMTCPAPIKDAIHAQMEADTFLLAKHLAPKTSSYVEIWLDGELQADYPFNPAPSAGEVEPLYGAHYMPRKFKIGISTAQDNCIDVLTHDLAILSLFEDGRPKGYNFALGGGLGMTHNNTSTYPRLATPIMFVPTELFVPATEAVIALQRDFGDRENRKHARLKYVIEERGAAWARAELERILGRRMEDPKAVGAYDVENHLGWHAQGDGKWFLGIPVSSGRILDTDGFQLRTALKQIISAYGMNLRLTADQNILLCDVDAAEKPAIEKMLQAHGVKLSEELTPLARHMLACVALPTCGKALAEAERIKLPLQEEIETVMRNCKVENALISVRIAGCPNGCSRPYVGDIGIVGRTPDTYALYIGGDFAGTRLNEKIFDKVPTKEIPAALEPMFAKYRDEKNDDEGFGDFAHRTGMDAMRATVTAALGATHSWAKGE